MPKDCYNGIAGYTWEALWKAGDYMPGGADIIKDYVSEFSRLQNWMLAIKEIAPETYGSMYDRYIELKVTLTSLGVNLTPIDKLEG